MDKSIKVSIIIPIYKVEQYLERCVHSVIDQTYENLEIILVDDGSPDNCPAMCDAWAQKDSRIRVVHKPNGGLSSARNAGMEEMTGEYVWFIDSDDYVETNAVELLLKNALENSSDIVIFNMLKDRSGSISKLPYRFEALYASPAQIREGLLSRYYTQDNAGLYSACNKLYRSVFIQENHLLFDPKDIRCEDCWFNFKAFQKAERISHLDAYLYYYFDNTSSITYDIKNISYERWVNNRKRLLKANEQFEFKIDFNSFYYMFNMNVIVYLKTLLKNGLAQKADSIMHDEFLMNSLSYDALLPKHFRFISRLIKQGKLKTVKTAYKLWNLK